MTPQDLADIEGVRRAVAMFCLRVDEYDMTGVAEAFTADADVDYGPGRGGPIKGRRQVVERISRGQAEFRRTHHQLGQSIVDVEGLRAHAITYVTAWHENWEGVTSEVRLRYLDDLLFQGDVWRIAKRRVHAAGAVGFPGTEWHYVSRALPDDRRV